MYTQMHSTQNIVQKVPEKIEKTFIFTFHSFTKYKHMDRGCLTTWSVVFGSKGKFSVFGVGIYTGHSSVRPVNTPVPVYLYTCPN